VRPAPSASSRKAAASTCGAIVAPARLW
jgi:hypothetical protein